ncbi:MAG: formylglycine-generating enzyme family protein [Bradymonadia bacterium]
MRRDVVLGVLVSGCSLVLDDPTPFVVAELLDAEVRLDTQLVDSRVVSDVYIAPDVTTTRDAEVLTDTAPVPPDAAPDAASLPDAAVADLGVEGDAEGQGEDARPPVDAAACVPGVEVCNGEDEDCDDRVDESDPSACQPCGLPGRLGICARGATVCVAGALQCVPWLPPEGTGEPCNTLDDDCDGVVDEAADVSPAPDPVGQALVASCGGRPDLRPEDGRCANDQLGCAEGHECVSVGCRINCHDARSTAIAACGVCDEGEVTLEACYDDCVALVEQVFRGCLSACSAIDQGGATRWSCVGGDDGPVCAALDCPEGKRADGQICVPDTEVCNNGLDDDGDGLVDGTLVGDDPCAALIDARAAPVRIGVCSPDSRDPTCSDNAALWTPENSGSTSEYDRPGGATNRHVVFDYAYAMDREEVSVRAYAECVRSGCCLEPIGGNWKKAFAAVNAGVSPNRPLDPPADVNSVDLDDPAQAAYLPDLPVTGLSWCMARDYCNWAGKRLPTEAEWEWTATRPAPGDEGRHAFPWGNAPAAQCPSDQCCRAADFAGPMPEVCVDADRGIRDVNDLPVCAGPRPEVGWRFAYAATYGESGEGCNGGEVVGAGPVYANPDGATFDGIVNLAGNVNEWVFDWTLRDYAGLNDTNPVGPLCDSTDFPRKRIVRGGDYTSAPSSLRSPNRFGLWESTRAPILGFRCGRTTTEDGRMCDPQMPAVAPQCRPNPAPGTPAPEPCAGPDFGSSDPADQALCPDAQRVESRFCDEGLSNFCPSNESAGAGCNAFIISRLELPVGLIGQDADIALMNTVMNNSLAPRGGSTILALAPNNVFRLGGNYRFGIGTAEVAADGSLVWIGVDRGGVCEKTRTGQYDQRTVQQRRDLTPSCANITGFEFGLRESPVSLPFSAVSVDSVYEPIDETLSGTLQLVMTLGDVARAQFGILPPGEAGDALGEVLDRVGASAINLCGLPLGASCLATPLYMPNCSGFQQCDDPLTCRGWPLPFRFEAVRADRAGLQNLVCP